MNIEIPPINSQPITIASGAAKLSPELAQLVIDLKVQIGDKLDALVNKITQISANDQDALLETKTLTGTPITKQLWQALLAQPTLKLVELKHDQVVFTAITDAPIQKGQLLTVLITARGIQLLAPLIDSMPKILPTPNLTPHADPQLLTKSGQPTSTFAALNPNQATASDKAIPLSLGQPANSGEWGNPRRSGLPSPSILAPRIANSAGGGLPTNPREALENRLEGSNAALQGKLTGLIIDKPTTGERPGGVDQKSYTAAGKAYALAPDKLTLTAKLAPEIDALTTRHQLPAVHTARASEALAQAIATSLPKAQSLSQALPTITRLMNVLKQMPPQALPPQLRPLMALLNKLDQHAIELKTSAAPNTNTIARAVHNNGIFFERNALRDLAAPSGIPTTAADASKPQSDDLKHLLILTLEALGLPATANSMNTKPPLSNDAVARLWLGLMNSMGNKGDTQKKAAAKQENLLQLAQALSQNALAKIQLNQFRSVSAGHHEPGQANQPLHLDIPIKWPDQYGNAHLQIYRPEIEKDEHDKDPKQKRKRLQQARWRVFMELDLGNEGSLAVDLSIADKRLDAMFWAEKESLRNKASAALQNLRKELTQRGIEVTDLRCSSNPPPEQKMNLDFAIIDIQT